MKRCDACGKGLEYIGYFKIPKDCKYVKDLGIKIPFGVRNVKICVDCVKKFNEKMDRDLEAALSDHDEGLKERIDIYGRSL